MKEQSGTTLTTRDRVGAACGAAYVVLILVGNALATGTNGPAHPSGTQVLRDMENRSHSTAVAVGISMELLGFVALAFFLGWFAALVRRRAVTAPWLADVVLAGGIATIAVKLGSALPESAVYVNRTTLDPQTARIFNDLASAGFVMSFLTFGIFLVALGLAVRDTRILGPVWSWIAVVLGVLAVAVTLGTQANPVTTIPLPFMLGLLWLLAACLRWTWSGPALRSAEPVDRRISLPA